MPVCPLFGAWRGTTASDRGILPWYWFSADICNLSLHSRPRRVPGSQMHDGGGRSRSASSMSEVVPAGANRSIIFDLDDTLFDSTGQLGEPALHLLARQLVAEGSCANVEEGLAEFAHYQRVFGPRQTTGNLIAVSARRREGKCATESTHEPIADSRLRAGQCGGLTLKPLLWPSTVLYHIPRQSTHSPMNSSPPQSTRVPPTSPPSLPLPSPPLPSPTRTPL